MIFETILPAFFHTFHLLPETIGSPLPEVQWDLFNSPDAVPLLHQYETAWKVCMR